MRRHDKLLFCFYSDPVPAVLSQQIAESFKLAVSLFHAAELEITGISCECREPVSRIKKHNQYSYRRFWKRIIEENTKGNLVYLELDHVPKGPEIYVAYDWLLHARMGVFGFTDLATCIVAIDCGVVRNHRGLLNANSLLDLCCQMVRIVKARYGFVTVMPRDRLPPGYATGLASGGATGGDRLVWDASSWGRGAWKEYDVKLRNVHALNFLTAQHLEQRIGNCILKEWINGSTERGVLRPWDERLFLWSLTPRLDSVDLLRWDSRFVKTVREELEEHNFFPWQRFAAGAGSQEDAIMKPEH